MIRSHLGWLSALTLAGAACAHQRSTVAQEPAPAAPPATEVASPAPAAAATPAPTRCSADADCASSELCIASTCQPITPAMAECSAAVVHFPLDQATLQDADLPALQRAGRCLAAARGLRLRIAGHADERGTAEYNIALGARRAAAVEKYLVTLGAEKSQVETVSYGKERPICQDHDESCWARNRRAQMERSF